MEGGVTEHVSVLVSAIGSFKDWSNYLLVTTVAALGWVASKDSRDKWVSLEVTFLAGSAIFGILTLSIVPIVTENLINHSVNSIYEVGVSFYVFGKLINEVIFWGPVTLKLFCFPQHALLILAIILHALRSWRKTLRNPLSIGGGAQQ